MKQVVLCANEQVMHSLQKNKTSMTIVCSYSLVDFCFILPFSSMPCLVSESYINQLTIAFWVMYPRLINFSHTFCFCLL